MDPIVISVVGALAAGALAAAKGVATDAVRDAYAALKRVVIDRFYEDLFVKRSFRQPASRDPPTRLGEGQQFVEN